MSINAPGGPLDFQQEMMIYMKNQNAMMAAQTAVLKEKDNSIKELSDRITELTKQIIEVKKSSAIVSAEVVRKEVSDFMIASTNENKFNAKRIKEADERIAEMNKVSITGLTMIGSAVTCFLFPPSSPFVTAAIICGSGTFVAVSV